MYTITILGVLKIYLVYVKLGISQVLMYANFTSKYILESIFCLPKLTWYVNFTWCILQVYLVYVNYLLLLFLVYNMFIWCISLLIFRQWWRLGVQKYAKQT